jgi:hypothetical protein
MAEQSKNRDQWSPETTRSGERGESFKREGPGPAKEDTGRNVDDMNRKAEESVVNNITPDEATD